MRRTNQLWPAGRRCEGKRKTLLDYFMLFSWVPVLYMPMEWKKISFSTLTNRFFLLSLHRWYCWCCRWSTRSWRAAEKIEKKTVEWKKKNILCENINRLILYVRTRCWAHKRTTIGHCETSELIFSQVIVWVFFLIRWCFSFHRPQLSYDFRIYS